MSRLILAFGFLVVVCLGLLSLQSQGACAMDAPDYINTWLVLGAFPNDEDNTGYERDWIGEVSVQPRQGEEAAGEQWRYFDDRLFSRNYDNYQDVRSYFGVKLGQSVAGVVAYLHAWVWSPNQVDCELRLGADEEFKCWLNGQPILASTSINWERDSQQAQVTLATGWNRLLLKLANQQDARLGCYARFCFADGSNVPGLVYSTDGPEGTLKVATQAMPEAGGQSLPKAFREWPYVGIDPDVVEPVLEAYYYAASFANPKLTLQAAPFRLTAAGGTPPYQWRQVGGELPEGLSLLKDGTITGTVAREAAEARYRLQVEVTDATGTTAREGLTLDVAERPNRWFEAAKLYGLIHGPERLSETDLPRFVETMSRQGYQAGCIITFNNGDQFARWPTPFDRDNPVGDVVAPFKEAIEGAGMKFGMYLGNLNAPEYGGAELGGILLVEDAMKRYNPDLFWFDWAGLVGWSLDALYSMIRSYNPDTVIVLNGVPTLGQGDWDALCLEGWGAWGVNTWATWPFPLPWAKTYPLETWRMVPDPEMEYSKGDIPDTYEMQKVALSIIGEGYVANLDHSPALVTGTAPGDETSPRGSIPDLDASIVWQVHQQLADWASPEGKPPLYQAYTNVDKGPLAEQRWGYNTISLDRTKLYLILLETERGKTGLPESREISLPDFAVPVIAATGLNGDAPLPFEQAGETVTLDLSGVTDDPIAVLIRLDLAEPYPPGVGKAQAEEQTPPGNLAWHRPAELLSTDASHRLVPSAFNYARYGVDGYPNTHAQGAYEYAWMYHVDLEDATPLERVVINFSPLSWATEYKVHLSADGTTWQTIAHINDCPGGRQEHILEAPITARYVRIEAVKPDGPDQVGLQMGISELEVYAAE